MLAQVRGCVNPAVVLGTLGRQPDRWWLPVLLLCCFCYRGGPETTAPNENDEKNRSTTRRKPRPDQAKINPPTRPDRCTCQGTRGPLSAASDTGCPSAASCTLSAQGGRGTSSGWPSPALREQPRRASACAGGAPRFGRGALAPAPESPSRRRSASATTKRVPFGSVLGVACHYCCCYSCCC